MNKIPYSQNRIYIGRIPYKADLVSYLTKFVNEENIKCGTITILGYMEKIVLTKFELRTKLTDLVEIKNEESLLEICTLHGVISQFKGRSNLKLSGTFKGSSGEFIGGTISLGSIVYACESVITEFIGATVSREFDLETGLPIWKNSLL